MSILEDFLKDSNAARTQDEVYDIFSKAVRKLGFDAEVYMLIKQFKQNPEEDPHNIRIHSMQDEILDYYVANQLENISYTHRTALEQAKIQPWYDKKIADHKDYMEFEKLLYTSGYSSGVCVPIYGQGTEKAIIALGKYHGKTSKDDLREQMLQIMGYHLHDRLKALSDNQQDPIVLSVREKEVLEWVMVGKSDSVISDIMGISDHTVNTYLRRCYTKLNVSNRIAAVVKAVSLSLISP